MALTPIPYTENWKDVYGAQGAPENTPAKMDPVSGYWTNDTGTYDETIVVVLAGGTTNYLIDWIDGSDPQQVAVATGTATHVYAQNGSYLIKIWDKDYPTNVAYLHAIVSGIPSVDVGPGGYAPDVLVDPTIPVPVQLGVTMKCDQGVWRGSPVPTITFIWKRNGNTIGNAPKTDTYTPVEADVGQLIKCSVSGENYYGKKTKASNEETCLP